MIDTHIHVVRPNLPGVGSLSPLLEQGPEAVAAALRREMDAVGVSAAVAMGCCGGNDDDPLGVAGTLAVGRSIPGLHAVGVADPRDRGEMHHHGGQITRPMLGPGVERAIERRRDPLPPGGAVMARRTEDRYHFLSTHPFLDPGEIPRRDARGTWGRDHKPARRVRHRRRRGPRQPLLQQPDLDSRRRQRPREGRHRHQSQSPFPHGGSSR
jgi:hypothetical protein